MGWPAHLPLVGVGYVSLRNVNNVLHVVLLDGKLMMVKVRRSHTRYCVIFL